MFCFSQTQKTSLTFSHHHPFTLNLVNYEKSICLQQPSTQPLVTIRTKSLKIFKQEFQKSKIRSNEINNNNNNICLSDHHHNQ